MALDILRHSVCHVDGRRIPETVTLKLPEIKLKTETLVFGGTDGEIEADLGLQKMEASIKLGAVNHTVMAQVGLRPGTVRTFNFDAALVSEVDASTKGYNVRMTGKIRDDKPSDWKHGDKSEWDYTIMVKTYKLTLDGLPLYHIDPLNFIRMIDGVDQLADIRRAMQLD